MRDLIKRILREETQKDLSSKIKKLLEDSVMPNHKMICKIDVVAPWKLIGNTSISDYQVMVTVIGGIGTKNWPVTQFVHSLRDKIVDDAWNTVYSYMGIPTDVFLRNVKSCDEVVSDESEKEEENEGAGAYDAPAFEMEPDHTTFKHEQKEAELTERCWKGYTQKGMKTMFGKRYPNCVKKTK